MTAAAELVKGRMARAGLPAPLTVAAGRQHTLVPLPASHQEALILFAAFVGSDEAESR